MKGTDTTMSIAHRETTDIALDRPARSAPATPTTYRIDPAASRIEFSINKRRFFVQHLVVTGRFTDVSGTITLDQSASRGRAGRGDHRRRQHRHGQQTARQAPAHGRLLPRGP